MRSLRELFGPRCWHQALSEGIMGEGATHAQEITHQSFPTHLQSDAGCVRRLGFFMGIYYELYVLFWMCMCIQGYYIYIIYIYIPLCFHEISRCFKRFLVGRGADARHDGEPAQLGRAGASGASCHWFWNELGAGRSGDQHISKPIIIHCLDVKWL
jgi:hypothetical protein